MVGNTISGTASFRTHWDRRALLARLHARLDGRAATAAFAGVAALMVLAPFERTRPLLQLPGQSISNLEAALLAVFVVWGAALLSSRRLPQWRTPITLPWLALLAAMTVASIAAPAARVNALHMTGRLTAALGVYLMTVNGVTTRGRLIGAAVLAVCAGVIVSALVGLEYFRVPAVLDALTAFRPSVTLIGTQLRAGGPLQYPTIASMYLEVTFACGVGVMLAAVDAGRRGAAAVLFGALVLIASAVTLTFTRAGLISIGAILALVGVVRHRRRGVDAGGILIAALAAVVAVVVLLLVSTESMWLRFTTEGQDSWYRFGVQAPGDVRMRAGGSEDIPVTLINTGRVAWDSAAAAPIFLSYHWMKGDEDRYTVFDGARTHFESPVASGETVAIRAHVLAPREAGEYRLVWDLVLEHRLWFSTEPGAILSHTRVHVEGTAATGARRTVPLPLPPVRPGRFVLWSAALRMIVAHPILGIGPDNFRLSYATYAGLPAADPRIHSNNMYIEVIAGSGLLGAAAFVWLLWRTARMLVAACRADRGPLDGAALGVAAAGLAIALHAVVDSFLSFAPMFVLFAMILGLAAVGARGAESAGHANRV